MSKLFKKLSDYHEEIYQDFDALEWSTFIKAFNLGAKAILDCVVKNDDDFVTKNNEMIFCIRKRYPRHLRIESWVKRNLLIKKRKIAMKILREQNKKRRIK